MKSLILNLMKTNDIPLLVESLRKSYDSGITIPLDYRIGQLRSLYEMMEAEEDRLCKALYLDLRKAKQEAITTELLVVRGAIVHMLNNLYEFAEPKQTWDKPIFFLGERVEVRRVPHGVVTIVSAWNYPIQC